MMVFIFIGLDINQGQKVNLRSLGKIFFMDVELKFLGFLQLEERKGDQGEGEGGRGGGEEEGEGEIEIEMEIEVEVERL